MLAMGTWLVRCSSYNLSRSNRTGVTVIQLNLTGHCCSVTYWALDTPYISVSLSLSELDSAALQLGRRVATPLLCYAMVSRLADFFFILRIDRGVTIILIEKLTEPSKTETRFTIDT